MKPLRVVVLSTLVMGLLAPVSAGAVPESDGVPLCFGRVPTIVGDDGDNVLVGTDGVDVIVGLDGKDLIMGGGSRDFICGGNGKDEIHGGWGQDKIDGEGGHDRIFGEGGEDRLKGSRGNDFMVGGKKHDVINGGGDVDECDAEEEKRCEPAADAIALELVSDDFANPVFVTGRPGDERIFVVDQGGIIATLEDDPVTVLDLVDESVFSGERGVLGLAFHPDEPERMFVNYIETGSNDSVVAEYDFPIAADAADPDPVKTILTLDQPDTNHNGGMLAFGPDGYLWMSFGDGGGQNDEYENGQDIDTLFGTILRIDVDSGSPYAVPADNPFVGAPGADEIFAYGLRNPWRFSFDGDDLYIADVGQNEWEELNFIDVSDAVPSGALEAPNLGWPIVEGPECFQEQSCSMSGLVKPFHWYGHSSGRCSVTGGYVYRGSAIPDLEGVYLFGDYCSGEIWAIGIKNGKVIQDLVLFDEEVFLLTSFGVDNDGEIYVTAREAVYKIVPG